MSRSRNGESMGRSPSGASCREAVLAERPAAPPGGSTGIPSSKAGRAGANGGGSRDSLGWSPKKIAPTPLPRPIRPMSVGEFCRASIMLKTAGAPEKAAAVAANRARNESLAKIREHMERETLSCVDLGDGRYARVGHSTTRRALKEDEIRAILTDEGSGADDAAVERLVVALERARTSTRPKFEVVSTPPRDHRIAPPTRPTAAFRAMVEEYEQAAVRAKAAAEAKRAVLAPLADRVKAHHDAALEQLQRGDIDSQKVELEVDGSPSAFFLRRKFLVKRRPVKVADFADVVRRVVREVTTRSACSPRECAGELSQKLAEALAGTPEEAEALRMDRAPRRA